MKDYALDLWRRAKTALRTAGIDADGEDYDAAASRAYYAAFYPVSAVLALDGKTFRRHSGVEAALHRTWYAPAVGAPNSVQTISLFGR